MYKTMLVFVTFFLCSSLCLAAQYPGYKITSMTEQPYGWQGTLDLISAGPYGADINTLELQVYFQDQQTLRIKIYDPSNSRWEVPFVALTPLPIAKPAKMDYSFSYVNNPFGFAITRTSTNDVIFNTSAVNGNFNGLIFEDQYLEISTVIPQKPFMYGLGERVYSLPLQTGQTYTIWNRDQGTPVQKNLYGTHPFYLEVRSPGNAHGVYLLNSNAMDVVVNPGTLTYKTIGGILDFFVFLGPSPADVIHEYQTVIGYPHMPPYWSLGWHQCRWGYKTIEMTADIVANYSQYQLPLDTMWNDIDYMDNYLDFTNDPVRFPQAQVKAFTQQLHANGQHYIMIIDPGISVTPGYPAYDQLLKSGAYLKVYGTNTPILGKVWPGLTYFPDFFHPNATQWWANQIAAFHAQGPEFDGIWIDMNEVSNFCEGQCPSVEESRFASVGTNWDNPPYVPGGTNLDTSTVNITAQQFGDLIQYNTHNMYGWSEGLATKNALESLFNKRSVVISRSTHAGSGSHNGHWLGDNNSQWPDLYYSIPGILAMQMFGVAQVGADICGFGGNTNEELCSRWMQLGTLYPFSRNHNAIGAASQEPWAFGPTLLNISRDSLLRRYTLLPYIYTLFAGAHNNGTTVWRPVFFEFPSDPNTYLIDKQFFIGKYLFVTPVLTQGATTVSGYFPSGVWYDYYNGTALTGTFPQTITLDAPLTKIPIHVRGGGVIPTQAPALTSSAARLNPFSLIVALDQSGYADGQLYLDDGESLMTMEKSNFTYVRYTATTSSSTTTLGNTVIFSAFTPAATAVLGSVSVFGVKAQPGKVTVNGNSGSFSYNAATSTLVINNINAAITASLEIIWS